MRTRSFPLIAAAFLVVTVAVFVTWSWPRSSEPTVVAHTETSDDISPSSLVLSATQINASGIETKPVLKRSFQAERTVPGRIHYDETKHVELRLAADGVIRKLLVRPGDCLTAGQIVAVVDSPEIGERRANVLLRVAEERLAEQHHELAITVQKNLARLLARLKESADVPTLLREFENEPLGDHRETVLGSYSKRNLADQLLSRLNPLASEGITSARSQLELRSTRETAEAVFQTACEAARVEAIQQARKAETISADARRQTAIARERLSSLLGTTANDDLENQSGDSLSVWQLRAPIAGTVEQLSVAESERVGSTTSVMTIADTTSLWVQAEIRDQDWGVLALVAGQQVRIEASVLPDQFLVGEVVYVGRVQESETRAVPIVVRVANEHDRLRPGMFARVHLPEGDRHNVLAIPASALVQSGRRQFVFVQESPRVFRDVDVVPGPRDAEWIAIKEGIQDGDHVVIRGAFALKGKLLLQAEE